jgi:hypothetical protein
MNDWSPRFSCGVILHAPVEFDALPQDRQFAFAAQAWFLLLPATLALAPADSGLIKTRCSTARMAARLRSVLHESHASRTRSDGGDVAHHRGRSGEPVILPPRGTEPRLPETA